jgi:hypothetical protein
VQECARALVPDLVAAPSFSVIKVPCRGLAVLLWQPGAGEGFTSRGVTDGWGGQPTGNGSNMITIREGPTGSCQEAGTCGPGEEPISSYGAGVTGSGGAALPLTSRVVAELIRSIETGERKRLRYTPFHSIQLWLGPGMPGSLLGPA